MKTSGNDLAKYQKQLKEIQDKHLFMTNFYGVEKGDEMNEKSEDFFKIFQNFFKQIENSLPKQEKKKAPPAKTGINTTAGPNPLIAELMKK